MSEAKSTSAEIEVLGRSLPDTLRRNAFGYFTIWQRLISVENNRCPDNSLAIWFEICMSLALVLRVFFATHAWDDLKVFDRRR